MIVTTQAYFFCRSADRCRWTNRRHPHLRSCPINAPQIPTLERALAWCDRRALPCWASAMAASNVMNRRGHSIGANAAVIGIDGARDGVRVDLEGRAERCGDLMLQRWENRGGNFRHYAKRCAKPNRGREGYRARANVNLCKTPQHGKPEPGLEINHRA